MLDEISREKPQKAKKKRTQPTRIANIGVTICIVTVILGLMTAFGWPQFIATGIYGLFGIYTYAIFFLAFFAGISFKMSRSYTVNIKYIICASVMIVALFTAIHIIVTRNQLDTMTFASYLGYGFNSITPGGVIFAIPAFVVWNVFDGMLGSSIVLGAVFIMSMAFLTTFIVSRHGVNKIIKKNTDILPAYVAPKKEDDKDLREHVEQRYQEILQKQGRVKHDKQKSELGLTTPATRTPTVEPIYDAAVPLESIAPQGNFQYQPPSYNNYQNDYQQPYSQPYQQPYQPQQQYTTPQIYQQLNTVPQPSPFIGDEVNQWSTDAANKLVQGVQQYAPPPPVQTTPIYEYESEQEEVEEEVYTPTIRARNKPQLGVAPGQTQFDSVMSESKPKKAYKPRRYVKPTLELIRTSSTDLTEFHIDAAAKQNMLDAKLKEFGVNAKVTQFTVAPAITRFEIQLGLGTRANDVYRLDPDFQYVLGTTEIRMENVPGKNAIGVEVPNKTVGCVSVRDILNSKEWNTQKNPLAVAIGKNLNDEFVIGDIGTMPHLLIAGSTGSGKSVCINTLLTSLIYRADPAEVKLLLVDMKLVELNMYNEIPHMLIPRSIGDVHQAINALKWMQTEMQRRYKILETNRFNHISQYHAQATYQNGQLERMPYIIMVIDEAADLIHNGKKEVEDAIKRLSALARACGIHIVLATQRPSVDVITAVIKTNFPVRIGFKVNSRGDSTTIINETGCEKLVGRGDMLFSKEGKIQRVQGAYIEVEEARRVMNFIRENNECDFDTELEDLILNGPPPENAATGFGDGPAAARNQDPLYIPVLRWLVRDENLQRTASISGIQRQFGLGFGRAGKIIDQLTANGYVSSGNGVKVREVLISKEEVDNLYGLE